MTSIICLSPELLEKILLHLDISDICRVAQTCIKLNHLINNPEDSHLWRAAFLQRYDDPRPRSTGARKLPRPKWKQLLREFGRAGHVLQTFRASAEHIPALELYLSLLDDAPHGIDVPSKNVARLYDLLARPGSEILYASNERPYSLSQSKAMPAFHHAKASAMLSTFIGIGDILRLQLSVKERAGARAYCYDLTTWKEANQWGPFHEDGTVDWCRMEVIMLTTCSNALDLIRALGVTDRTRLPCRLSAARPYSAPGWDDNDVEGDWAGVTGHWRRCISFLDWNDLQRYQGAVASGLGADYFERFAGPNGFTGEAVRVLNMQLRVVNLKPAHFRDRPTIEFEGVNDTGAMHESKIYGKVQMRANGDIKWTLISRYNGQDRWSSVGAQVGGIRSEYGVLGLWSGSDHAFDMGDPAGPFAMWKVHEDEPDPHDGMEESDQDDARADAA